MLGVGLGLGVLLVSALLAWVHHRFPPGVADRIVGPPASPSLADAVAGSEPEGRRRHWQEHHAQPLFEALQSEIYGQVPPPIPVQLCARRLIDPDAFGGLASLEQLTISLDLGDPLPPLKVNLILARPKSQGPHPLISIATFCGNRKALKDRYPDLDLITAPPKSCERPPTGSWVRAFMGRYLSAPPLEDIVRRGFAATVHYPCDLIPDDPQLARPVLARFAALSPDRAPPGALACWAWLYSRILDQLSTEAQLDAGRIAIFGHSRHGKASLLAAAADPRVAAVIAHQSGKGGATLTRSFGGETVAQITERFPHWFGPSYRHYAAREADLSVDQHQLVALIAPRPVLLGNGRLDQWADPEGSFRTLQGADPVYRGLGTTGLTQSRMTEFDPKARLAFFLRPGVHGITAGDWKRFLAFLEVHLGQPLEG